MSSKPYCYEYLRPAVTVDCVVFGVDDESLKVLLIKRDLPPHAGRWALPGGFVADDEGLEGAAARELEGETGLRDIFLEQLFTFGDPQRDPRGRVITVAYYGLVNIRDHRVRASTDARDAGWFAVDAVPALPFDHGAIFETALRRLRGKVRYEPIGFELLPPKFTLFQLQRLYEMILARPLDKRNFRKKILSMGVLKDLDEVEQGVARRAARLYKFDAAAYRRLAARGFNFEI